MASHLTLQEREVIAQMHRAGKMQTQIADRLCRSKSTISRELRRNRSRNGYWAVAAQRKAANRRSQRPWVGKMERPEVRRYVPERLRQRWSPDQIAGRSRSDFPHDRRRQNLAPDDLHLDSHRGGRGKALAALSAASGPQAAGLGKPGSDPRQHKHRGTSARSSIAAVATATGRGTRSSAPTAAVGRSRWSSGSRDMCCWGRSPICRRPPSARSPPSGIGPRLRGCGRPSRWTTARSSPSTSSWR